MSALAVVRFAAVLTTGLLAGIFVGDRMGASFARPALPLSSFVRLQQIQHVHFAKMMPILLGIAILSKDAGRHRRLGYGEPVTSGYRG